MNKSNIEYLTHVWNFYPGCNNQENGVCKLPCWAKAQAHRFGRSFEPRFNEKIFNAPMPKEPARIGVCFTGDLFGDWVSPNLCIEPLCDTILLKNSVRIKLLQNQEHQFFFLTKCPANIKKWGSFPPNAWVGVTCLNAEQVWLAIENLKQVEAKHKWLSIEPLQGPLFNDDWRLNQRFTGIDWIVVGGQTQPVKNPQLEWVADIKLAAHNAGIPLYLKNNLQGLLFDKLAMSQQLPNFKEAT